MKHFLTIPEEIFLLTLNEEGEHLKSMHRAWDIVFAGAILMDLALQRRIDTDVEYVIPDNTISTGDNILNQVLMEISKSDENKKISYWLAEIRKKAPVLLDALITNLIRKGVIKIENQRVLWFFSSRKYPTENNTEIKEVKERVREGIMGNNIPDFRDLVIISLAYNGDMLELILQKEEIEKYIDRIEQLAKMDLVGQAVSNSLKELTLSVMIAMKAKELLGVLTPEEKLTELVEKMKVKMKIENENDLPDWLKKGTDQYKKTLRYIEEQNTGDIIFDPYAKKYKVKQYGRLMD
ncbi:MAG: GPP34 family phosphoprotein [Bacteroidales bacterium]|nr:GPP34 family phosphoprotein [Bacteroidales bacterium]